MALVCHCEVVNERKIVKAIERGAHSVEEVGAACGAGRACGGCIPTIETLLVRHGPKAAAHTVRVVVHAG